LERRPVKSQLGEHPDGVVLDEDVGRLDEVQEGLATQF
jgi:hypothetical protein